MKGRLALGIAVSAALCLGCSPSHAHEECTRSHTTTILIPVGKVMVPMTQTVCDEWTPKEDA